MKLLFSLTMATLASAALPIYGSPKKAVTKDMSIQADSAAGAKLLSKARRLEQDEEIDFTWVSNFSIRFQGCHHISQWNEEADGEEDVRIQTKRLVRFRLCPTGSCSLENAGGCDSGYGDYIIDMNTYLEAYFQAKEEKEQWQCEYFEQMVCENQCGNNRNRKLNEDYCMYDCYEEQGEGWGEICMDQNPYNQNQEEEEEVEIRDGECMNWDIPNNNRRKLEEEEIEYFMGPYCAEQGGAIYMGIFTDDTCTTFADDYGGRELYNTYTGKDLPYGESNLIEMDCISCKEPEEIDADGNNNNNQNNNNQDPDDVIEMCEMVYAQAGKCESKLSGYVNYPNENACNYMEGIKIVRQDGIVEQMSAKANKGASIFIGIFVVAFVLLAAYVYFLKTKLDRASINLSE